jgi:hypothetical protein
MKSSMIFLLTAFIIFVALFVSFWCMFMQSYFNESDRNIMLGIIIAIIAAAFLLALAISNRQKVFNWKEFKEHKTPTELKLIACECLAEAGMMETEIAKQLEDRMRTIDDNHNIELIKLKAEIKNQK